MINISIHASHAGCDGWTDTEPSYTSDFNPRIPCGMRRGSGSTLIACEQLFQSTHPMRDATATYSECLIKVAKYSPFAQLI